MLTLVVIINIYSFVPLINKEVKLKAGNSCYSVQTLSSSRLLFKNLKIKIYKTIILRVVLYGCKTWYLSLRD